MVGGNNTRPDDRDEELQVASGRQDIAASPHNAVRHDPVRCLARGRRSGSGGCCGGNDSPRSLSPASAADLHARTRTATAWAHTIAEDVAKVLPAC
jgi:hypothetical protein